MNRPTIETRRRPVTPARRIVAPTPEDDDPTTKMAAALRREVAKWYCERGIAR